MEATTVLDMASGKQGLLVVVWEWENKQVSEWVNPFQKHFITFVTSERMGLEVFWDILFIVQVIYVWIVEGICIGVKA